VGDRLTISMDDLRHGWVNINLAKAGRRCCLAGVSYSTDFIGDLAGLTLSLLYREQSRHCIWFDCEGSGWLMRITSSQLDNATILQCGDCDSLEQSRQLTEGGDFRNYHAGNRKFLAQTDNFEVAITPTEFGEAVLVALVDYEKKFSVHGIVPCNFVSQPNRPIAAIQAVLKQPYTAYVDTSEAVATVIINLNDEKDPE
jgi:hypothetical protein